jgi:sulfoxide reductase heme-binding subunit YedZ
VGSGPRTTAPSPPANSSPRDARNARRWTYALVALTIAGELFFAWADSGWDTGPALLEATQFAGLTAFGALLVTVAIGPLFAVFPRAPLRAHFQYARRALGVSTFALGALHALLYVVPAVARNWHELVDPGWSWIAGLGLGVAALALFATLAVTSTDAAVRRMGGRRWKALHRWARAGVAVVLVHAVVVGSDFGLRPFLRGVEGDMGCLVGFSVAAAAWLTLFVIRARRRVRPASGSSSAPS